MSKFRSQREFVPVAFLPMNRDPSTDERLHLAQRRVRSVLSVRGLASQYQLQSKISEAGPTPQRCNPHVLTNALRTLSKTGEVATLLGPGRTTFYYLVRHFEPDFDPGHALRRDQIFDFYSKYQKLTHSQPACGDALESVISTSIDLSGAYIPLGQAKANPLKVIGGIDLKGNVDFVLDFLGNPTFYALVEAKNRREWVYPGSELLWKFIEKCVQATDLKKPILPVFIARKIQHLVFPFMKQIGMLGHQTHNQYLNPPTDEERAWITPFKDKDILGFFDIRTDLTPSKELNHFFSKTVVTWRIMLRSLANYFAGFK